MYLCIYLQKLSKFNFYIDVSSLYIYIYIYIYTVQHIHTYIHMKVCMQSHTDRIFDTKIFIIYIVFSNIVFSLSLKTYNYMSYILYIWVFLQLRALLTLQNLEKSAR